VDALCGKHYLVDCQAGFDVKRMTYDGLHPHNKGEAFIAKRFWQALEVAMPEPPPKP
jgi:lysophospholipase L1-like esterase